MHSYAEMLIKTFIKHLFIVKLQLRFVNINKYCVVHM